jgi:2-oxoglutarate ferredoxin oxidoreductase subunit gamma
MVANIIALGALATLTKVVTPKSLEAAVLARVPKGTEELNRKALQLGRKAAKAILKEREPESIQGHGPNYEDTPYE